MRRIKNFTHVYTNLTTLLFKLVSESSVRKFAAEFLWLQITGVLQLQRKKT